MNKQHPWSQFLRRLFIWSAHLLVLVTPFLFTWVNEELFEFNKMMFVYAITVVMAGAWVGRRIIEKKWRWPRTYVSIPLLLFVVSQVLSTLFSIHPYTSWFGYYTRFHGGLLSTLCYSALFWMMSTELQPKEVLKLLNTWLVAALGVALYAVPESLGHSPSCWLISGGQHFDVSCWKQDVQSRIFGTFGQPNWLAAYGVMTLPFAIILTLRTQKMPLKILTALVSVLLFWMILLTKSRSALVAIGAMGSMSLMLLLIRDWRQGSRLSTVVKLGLVIALCTGLLVSSFGQRLQLQSLGCFLAPDTFFAGLRSTISPDTAPLTNSLETGGTDSGIIRCIVWNGAWKISQRYPLFGSGVETFAYSYYQDRPIEHNYVSEWDFLYNKAHNEVLNFLATTGIAGLVTYLVLIGSVVAMAMKKTLDTKASLDNRLIAAGISISTIGLTVTNVLGFSTVTVTMLLFVAAAMLHSLHTHSQPEKMVDVPNKKNSATSLQGWQLVSLAVVSVGVIWGISMIWSWWQADHVFYQGKSYLTAGYTLEGLTLLEQAVQMRPYESTFTDELAATYAQIAVGLQQQGEATAAAEFALSAQQMSDFTLLLNSRHLNWYKSRASMFMTLAQFQPDLLNKAVESLRIAQNLAPTDPKIRYNLGLIYASQQATESARTEFNAAVELRPNYIQAQEALEGLSAAASATP